MSIRKAAGFAVAASLFATVCATPDTASAQSAVSGTGKGIVGGVLLGGEVGFLVLSAARARQGWMYVVFPGLTAVGGGIAGYFIEKSATPEVPLYMLAGGMALIIPTVVITLSANVYRPTNTEDSTPPDATPADAARPAVVTAPPPAAIGGAAGGAETPTTAPAAPPPKHKPPKPTSSLTPQARPFALVDVAPTSVTVGLPLVRVSPAYSRDELDRYGLAQHYEVRAQLLSVAF